jgi:hypothetical protein
VLLRTPLTFLSFEAFAKILEATASCGFDVGFLEFAFASRFLKLLAGVSSKSWGSCGVISDSP